MHLSGRFSSGRTPLRKKTLAKSNKASASRLNSKLVEKIVSEVREEEIVAMCCDVINIPSPTGEEAKMAEHMRAAWESIGLEVTWQEVEEGRANVVARWEGAGSGRCLMFNGHMDTSNTGQEDFLTGIGYKPNAVIKDGMIYGLGIYNMKGALVCYTHAVKALQRAGVTASRRRDPGGRRWGNRKNTMEGISRARISRLRGGHALSGEPWSAA